MSRQVTSSMQGAGRRRLAAPALLLLGCYLLATFASYEHLQHIAHVRCSEHGEPIHLPTVDRGGPAGQAEVPGLHGGGLPARTGGPDHEHCAVAFHLGGRQLPAGPGLQLAHLSPGPSATPHVTVTRTCRPPVVPLLHLAPKLPPPPSLPASI